MHKLKNKHTGEVITTPYMAEVEEYLNSGDYEMTKPMLKIAQNSATVYESEDLTLNVKGLFFVERETNTLYAGEQVERLLHANKYMESCELHQTRPVYTKEMQERGELPAVGMELLIAFKGGNTFRGKIKYISTDGFVFEKENGKDSFNGSLDVVGFKPLPTIEDELQKLIRGYYSGTSKANDLTSEILSKYNITPKEK